MGLLFNSMHPYGTVVCELRYHTYRLVTDKETGRQKGFGFCEYFDRDTAQSAIRNLSGHEVNGRHLRVDCTDASSDKGDRSESFVALNRMLSQCKTCCNMIHLLMPHAEGNIKSQGNKPQVCNL